MTFRVVTQAVYEFKCEWCGDVEQLRASEVIGGLPEGWYKLSKPHHPPDEPWEQLCVLCGMRATYALANARFPGDEPAPKRKKKAPR